MVQHNARKMDFCSKNATVLLFAGCVLAFSYWGIHIANVKQHDNHKKDETDALNAQILNATSLTQQLSCSFDLPANTTADDIGAWIDPYLMAVNVDCYHVYLPLAATSVSVIPPNLLAYPDVTDMYTILTPPQIQCTDRNAIVTFVQDNMDHVFACWAQIYLSASSSSDNNDTYSDLATASEPYDGVWFYYMGNSWGWQVGLMVLTGLFAVLTLLTCMCAWCDDCCMEESERQRELRQRLLQEAEKYLVPKIEERLRREMEEARCLEEGNNNNNKKASAPLPSTSSDLSETSDIPSDTSIQY